MNIKNIAMSFVLVLGSIVGSAASDRDEYGRTALMNYVINQEAKISATKRDIDHLWHICYEYVSVQHGYVITRINDRESISEPTYKAELRRRISCTDADIHALKQQEANLRCLIDATVAHIRSVGHQANCAAYDYDGYTVLNYCYTFEIYSELRRQGAPFQAIVWAYFHPKTAAAISLATTAVAVTSGMHVYKFAHDWQLKNNS